MNNKNRCDRCDGTIKSWAELGDEQQEVVMRLPGSAECDLDERKRSHLWCIQCWNETVLQPQQT